MNIEEQRKTLAKQICEALKLMYLKGLITPLTGNISVRIGDTILITPSSFIPTIRLKYELKPEDLVEVDIKGNIIKGGRPTTELPMHLEIYRSCEKCNAIVHIHGIYSPLLSSGDELFLDTELKYILKPKICFVDEYTPRTHELAKAVTQKIAEECEIVYLKRHGVVTISDNLGMALELAELAEVIATRTVVSKLIRIAKV
jgi:Ribulose-5-phosphate 4-epimerase and related epimerases and aldolases